MVHFKAKYVFLINLFTFLLTEKMDSSSYKRFLANVDSILESLEDVDLAATGEHLLLQYFYDI